MVRAGLSLACVLMVPLVVRAQTSGGVPQEPQSRPVQDQAPAAPVQPQAGPPGEPQDRPQPRQRTVRRNRQPRHTRSLFLGNLTPKDPNRTRQELTFTANLQGGYDDNLAAGEGSGAGTVPASAVSGQTGYLDAALDYFKGNPLRSIRVRPSANLRAYPGYLDSATPGYGVTIEGATAMGDRDRLGAVQQLTYDPLFNFGVPWAGGSGLALGPGATNPTTGLFERRSLTSLTSALVDHRWSRRDSTRLSYSYLSQQFTDDEGGDNSFHRVAVEYKRALRRAVSARAGYRHSNGQYNDLQGVTRPTRVDTVEGGPEVETFLSRHRRLTFSLGGGASHIETVNAVSGEAYDYWTPFGSGSLTLGLSATWSMAAEYRRSLSVLDGLTPQSYITDNANFSVGGLMTTRTDVSFGATYGTGRTPVSSGASDSFRVYGSSVQLRAALTPRVAAIASYHYYFHRYSNPSELPGGFPAEYDRHAVRVGLTVWVPLLGAFSTPGERGHSR